LPPPPFDKKKLKIKKNLDTIVNLILVYSLGLINFQFFSSQGKEKERENLIEALVNVCVCVCVHFVLSCLFATRRRRRRR
jgi:hypothetical protein